MNLTLFSLLIEVKDNLSKIVDYLNFNLKIAITIFDLPTL